MQRRQEAPRKLLVFGKNKSPTDIPRQECDLNENPKSTRLPRIPGTKRQATTQNGGQTKRCRNGKGASGGSKMVDHCNTMAAALGSLFNNPDCSDVIVSAGKQHFYLHKLMLMRSTVFRIMLTEQRWDDSQKSKIYLGEMEECEDYMEPFLKYFYTAKVALKPDNVLPLLILANKYEVEDLESACEKYACDMVFHGVEPDLILQWWMFAYQINMGILFRKAKDYICLNIESIMSCPRFLTIDRELLLILLKERDIVVSSENLLFKHAMEWVNQEERKHNYTNNFSYVAKYTRFSMMTPEELCELEASLDEESRAAIRNQMFEAFRFHSLPFLKRGELGLAGNEVARLYTRCDDDMPCICSTLRIYPEERVHLNYGVKTTVDVPVSLSNADHSLSKDWNLNLEETDAGIVLELATVMVPKDRLAMVETSFLIHRHMNGYSFVKGVMQLRALNKMVPADDPVNHAGHIFTVTIPSDALDEGSSYQIPHATNSERTHCMFQLIMRHYHQHDVIPSVADNQVTERISPPAHVNKPGVDC